MPWRQIVIQRIFIYLLVSRWKDVNAKSRVLLAICKNKSISRYIPLWRLKFRRSSFCIVHDRPPRRSLAQSPQGWRCLLMLPLVFFVRTPQCLYQSIVATARRASNNRDSRALSQWHQWLLAKRCVFVSSVHTMPNEERRKQEYSVGRLSAMLAKLSNGPLALVTRLLTSWCVRIWLWNSQGW